MRSLAPAEKAPAAKPRQVGFTHEFAQRKPSRPAATITASEQQTTPACTACVASGAPCPACAGGAQMLQRQVLGSGSRGATIQATARGLKTGLRHAGTTTSAATEASTAATTTSAAAAEASTAATTAAAATSGSATAATGDQLSAGCRAAETRRRREGQSRRDRGGQDQAAEQQPCCHTVLGCHLRVTSQPSS